MNKFILVLMFFAVLLIPSVYAQSGSIKLLALSELSNGSQSGVITDLNLELKHGSERVFLDTFPLTKITTQISMRFAQQIACKELDVDCSQYDFFYTIKALLGLIGGPSAGSAATLLTASLITGETLDKTMTITGTINSGGIIGPVGGLKYKIEAASKNGLKTVLIPSGSRVQKDGNRTIDLFAYGKKLNLTIIEVSTFEEAFDLFTGKNHSERLQDFVIDDKYMRIMKNVAGDICNRTKNVESKVKTLVVNKTLAAEVVNFARKASSSLKNGQYYSAASYCFRTNLLLKQINIVAKKPSRERTLKNALNASSELRKIVANLSGRKLASMTDLQAYMAVDERLFEAGDALARLKENSNDAIASANLVAYAEERISSASAWSKFFENNDRRFEINNLQLQQSCMNKISEAEERYNYVKDILPISLGDTRKELDRAYYDLANQSYVMCLYRASKAKASSDVILSVLGVDESKFGDVLKLKLDIVKREIVKSQNRGIFPIIGYSYYEYANSLVNVDKSSALLFAEYALELTNIDMYFSKKNGKILPFFVTKENVVVFVLGFCAGLFFLIFYNKIFISSKRKKNR